MQHVTCMILSMCFTILPLDDLPTYGLCPVRRIRNYLYVQRHMGAKRAAQHIPEFAKRVVAAYDADGSVSKRCQCLPARLRVQPVTWVLPFASSATRQLPTLYFGLLTGWPWRLAPPPSIRQRRRLRRKWAC